jgi:hypothetical protein
MIANLRNKLKFYLERMVLRGAHYRLLVIGAIIGLVSIVAGILVFLGSTEFSSGREAVWWAFLRLTDPGYLGDDKGAFLRTVSTVVTVLGYVLFMGSLIAIMTQWLSEKMNTFESGLTPIVQKNHVLILGWGNRTPTVVHELLLSEGRVRRFLRRHGARKLRIVILSEEVTTERRYELRDYLGPDWDEHQIIFRSGSPLRIEHLRRVDFLNAAAIILPGTDFEWGDSNAADMRAVKTLLSISNHGSRSTGALLPFLVAEIFDARKIAVAKAVYKGRLEVLASDAMISLLITQNVRHRWLSHVYTEMLTHGEDSNEIYIRECPELEGTAFQDLVHAFPKAILLGVLRPEGEIRKPILNPTEGFKVDSSDLLVFMAQHYEHTQPASDYTQTSLRRGVQSPTTEVKRKRRILLLGWNDKVPALIYELDSYENESFDIDILSTIPIDQRENRMARYALHPHRVILKHVEGDYSAPSDLRKIHPEQYDNVVILGCDWLESKEEADARTILGYLLLRQILAESKETPEVLVELLDPQNHELLPVEEDEVLISPMILSHILAHVALRPGLNAVFQELFSSGGAEIFFRQVGYYGLAGRELPFREIQETVFQLGEIAIGVRIPANSTSTPGGVELNPNREKRWDLGIEDEVVVLTTYS